jgi:hypothetical protein
MNLSKLFMAGAIAGMVSVPAMADDDTGGYLGVSANRMSANQRDVNDLSFDDSDTAYGLKGGYMFTNLLGLEGGYLDLGDYSAGAGTNALNLDAEGFYLVGVLNFTPADKWDIYGKLGAFALDTNTDLTDFDESSTELYGGIGTEYDFGQWNIFGEYSWLDTDVNDLTFDTISIGLKYEFSR